MTNSTTQENVAVEKRKKQGVAHTITVIVEGGMVQEVRDVPPGIEVVIQDYDTEGVDEEELLDDEDGEDYFEAAWSSA